MAMTLTAQASSRQTSVEKWVETSGANSLLTATTTTSPAKVRRLLYVAVAYSGSPTQTGVTVTLDAGAGAGYDATLAAGVANARYTVYLPESEVILDSTDLLVVSAPAGGGSLTSSVSIYMEQLS